MIVKGCLLALLASAPAWSAPADAGKAAEASGNFEQAAGLYKAAADAGDGEAQYRLGGLYAGGKGVPLDYADALSWYRKAAEQGLENAQFNLAALYANGQGTRRDYGEAAKWWRKAADIGHGPSQLQLCALYEAGRGVAQSTMEAFKWCRLASEQGADAAAPLERLSALLPPKQLTSAQWLAEQYHDKIEAAKLQRKARQPKTALVAIQAPSVVEVHAPAPAPEAAPAEPPKTEAPAAPRLPAQAERKPEPAGPLQAPAQTEFSPPPAAPKPEARPSSAWPFTAAVLLALLVPFGLVLRRALSRGREVGAGPAIPLRAPRGKPRPEAGEERKALEELLQRPKSLMTKAQYAEALRLCLKLGEFKATTRLFVDLQTSHPISDAPELYYYYAILCEKQGDLLRARDVYRMIVDRFPRFKDAATRMNRLDGIPPEETTRLTSVLAARGPGGGGGAAIPPALIAGKFELLEPLGVGGMGVVYKAFDRALGREVAVKKMQSKLAPDEDARATFIEEARTVAALNHPYIVAIYDIVNSDGEIYLVFEFVDGETLLEITAGRGGMGARECARALRFVCEALAYAHENGVVHRDLKPSNLMLNSRGYVKVMDFGLALRPGGAGADAAGTPPYMAPEQHKGQATAAADVYALGVTAYELLTGDLPFNGNDLYGQKMSETYKPLPPEVPQGLRELVAQCLKANPSERPSGAADMLARLSSAV